MGKKWKTRKRLQAKKLSCELCGKPVALTLHNYVSGATGKAVCGMCLTISQTILPSVEKASGNWYRAHWHAVPVHAD